jgi:hypothetical protein
MGNIIHKMNLYTTQKSIIKYYKFENLLFYKIFFSSILRT